MPDLPDDFVFFATLITIVAVIFMLLIAMTLLISRIRVDKREMKAESDPRFPGREPLTLDGFYEKYYAANQFPRVVVLDVLTRFATAARVTAAVLHPEDSFISLSEAAQPDQEACEQFAIDTASSIREAEQRYGASLFSGKLDTLDDYIRTTVLAHRLMSGK